MGIGDWISGIFGTTNKSTAATPNVDPNAYRYGGQPGGANAAVQQYSTEATRAQNQAAPQAANVGVDYGQANADAAQGQQSRQGQSALANVLGQRAMGGAPTISQMQADRQMQQAQAAQASMAASARGAGGLANAQRNAANNVANTQANISGQAQMNGAQEVLNNTNAASAAYGNLRAGDQASQGQDASQAQFANQSAVNQGQFNAQQQSGQNALNAQTGLAYNQLANQVNDTQLTANMNQQAQQSGNSLNASGINAGVGGQNASMNQANAMNVVGMAQGAAGAAAGALTGKATGGPVAGRTPYLVGEKGPELIVPKKDGFVLTADQTQQALRGAPSSTINSLFAQRSKDAATPSLASVLGAPPRADGGPVQSGGAPSTWGTGQAQMSNQQALGPAWNAAMAARPAYMTGGADAPPMTYPAAGFMDPTTGMPTKSNRAAYEPLQQADEETVMKHEAQARYGALPENSLFGHEADDEQKKYETAKYRAESTAKGDKKEASAARKSKLSAVLGDMGAKTQEAARGIDTSYHGGSAHYAAPSLLALPGRAMGGPVDAGGAVAPTVAMPEYVLGPSGGMNTMATLRAESAKSTGYGANPVAGVVPAREDGGPVDAGGASAYETKLTPDQEKKFVVWKAQYAPKDSGGDYDLRGAFKAGEKPGADGHWTDRFKKPNHPTFSNESQYATGPNAARAGSWNGDTFIPSSSAGARDAGAAPARRIPAANVAAYTRDRERNSGVFANAQGQAQMPVAVPPPPSAGTQGTREDAKNVGTLAALATPFLGPLVGIGYGSFAGGLAVAAEQKAAKEREEAERQSQLARVLATRAK